MVWLDNGATKQSTFQLLERLTGWLIVRLTSWLSVWLTGWLSDLLTAWLYDWLAVCLTYWLAGWLSDWLPVCLTDCLAVWLTDCLTDCLNNQPTIYLQTSSEVFACRKNGASLLSCLIIPQTVGAKEKVHWTWNTYAFFNPLPTARFVNYVYTVKTLPLTFTFPHCAQPTVTGLALCHQRFGQPCFTTFARKITRRRSGHTRM
jgi:hypothetical protein